MPLEDRDTKAWQRVLTRLKVTVGEKSFSSWLTTLHLEGIRKTDVYCSVPTVFLRRWIEDHYAKAVTDCVKQEWPDTTQVFLLKRSAGQPIEIPEEKEPEAEEVQEDSHPTAPLEELGAVERTVNDTCSTSTNNHSEQQCEATPSLPLLDPHRRIFLSEILQHACKRYDLPEETILSHRKKEKIVRPRQIGMFLSKHMTSRSFPEIGRRYGGRDHTTVISAVRKIQELIYEDVGFAFEVASLEAQIRQLNLAS